MLKWHKIGFMTRTIMIAAVALISGVALMMVISYYGIKTFFVTMDQEMLQGVNHISMDHLKSRIDQSAQIIDLKMTQYRQEQAILASVAQTLQDHKADFAGIMASMSTSPYFKDNLTYNGNWYENSSNEPSVVLVQKYNLDAQNRIRPEVQENLKDSLIMDLLYPSFYKNGPHVQAFFFTGGEGKSYMRLSPWVDLGKSMDAIYPNHSTEENWNAFSPGLIEAWKRELLIHPEYKNDLSKLAIIKPPSLDGGSGSVIMTMNHPVFDGNRKKLMGSVNVDISLTDIIHFVESINVGKTGFAYISSGNGNILAVNEQGTKVMGIPQTSEATEKGPVKGYKRMFRYFVDSQYDSIKRISQPQNDDIQIKKLIVNGTTYLHFQKRLKGFNSWSTARGLYKDYWTMGYLIPEQEVLMTYNNTRDIMEVSRKSIILKQSMVAVLMTLSIFAIVVFAGRRSNQKLIKLEAVTQEIMAHNFNVDIDVYAEDEIGHLAEAMRKMKTVIKETFSELNAKNEALSHEIKARESKEKQIMYLENYDQLTNLPQTDLMLARVQEIIDSKEFGNHQSAWVVIGLDEFRKVNDTYSHQIGNEVIKAISNLLASMNHPYEVLAKLRGDEFALLYSIGNSLEDLLLRIREVQNLFTHPIPVEGHDIYLSASIGIATYPTDGSSAEELFKKASMALNHAKEGAKGTYRFYDSEMDAQAKRKMEILSNLRKALGKQEFYLMYQPIIDLQTDKPTGFEALIRWQPEQGDMIYPNVFVPMAEESGLIIDIGEWIMQESLMQLKKWHDLGYSHLSMSINISSAQFNESNFLEKTTQCIASCEVPPEKIRLEITEGMLLNDIDRVNGMLTNLRKMGVGISIDDFGTGYSSLNYLKNLQATTLKIDKSFISEYPDKENGTIAKVIVDLGRNLAMKVVAEGVETEEQKQFLKNIHCDEVQGYLFSKPMLVSDVESYLQSESQL